MDGSRTVVVSLVAEAPVKLWLDTVTPDLYLRCKERRIQAYVITGSAAANESYDHIDEGRVRFRVDSAAAISQWWSESTDSKALFASNSKGLITSLAGATWLLFEFTPFNASPVQVRFKVKGLDAYLPRLKAACNWK
jgi:hypothetical protein